MALYPPIDSAGRPKSAADVILQAARRQNVPPTQLSNGQPIANVGAPKADYRAGQNRLMEINRIGQERLREQQAMAEAERRKELGPFTYPSTEQEQRVPVPDGSTIVGRGSDVGLNDPTGMPLAFGRSRPGGATYAAGDADYREGKREQRAGRLEAEATARQERLAQRAMRSEAAGSEPPHDTGRNPAVDIMLGRRAQGGMSIGPSARFRQGETADRAAFTGRLAEGYRPRPVTQAEMLDAEMQRGEAGRDQQRVDILGRAADTEQGYREGQLGVSQRVADVDEGRLGLDAAKLQGDQMAARQARADIIESAPTPATKRLAAQAEFLKEKSAALRNEINILLENRDEMVKAETPTEAIESQIDAMTLELRYYMKLMSEAGSKAFGYKLYQPAE
jgi:hypothetical protein